MRVLITGLGSIAKKHIHALRTLAADTDIYALRSDQNAPEIAGVSNITSLSQVNESFDFAIVSTPTAVHYDSIVQLLPLGIPLFIEKPLFHTLENGEKILDACRSQKAITYIACNLRFHPCVQYLKAYLEKNSPFINEVNIYCGSYLPEWRPQVDFRKNYSAIPEMGGGVHLDLIHELDYACWLLGKPLGSVKTLGNSSSLQIRAIDYAHYQLQYPRYFANITLNYFRRSAKRQMEILIDDRTIEMDLLKNDIYENGSLIYSLPTDVHYTYIKQMDYFLKAIKQGTPLMNDINEAYDILKICLQ